MKVWGLAFVAICFVITGCSKQSAGLEIKDVEPGQISSSPDETVIPNEPATPSTENASSPEAKKSTAQPPSTTVQAKPGPRIESNDKTFSLQLPATWVNYDASDALFQNRMSEVRKVHVDAALQSEKLAKSNGLAMLASDIHVEFGQIVQSITMTCNALDMPAELIDEQEIKLGAEYAAKQKFGDQANPVEVVKIDGNTSAKFGGSLTQNGLTTTMIGYQVPVKRKLYTFTFTCPSMPISTFEKDIESIMKSVKFK